MRGRPKNARPILSGTASPRIGWTPAWTWSSCRRCWDTGRSAPTSSYIAALALSPDGRTVATAGPDGKVLTLGNKDGRMRRWTAIAVKEYRSVLGGYLFSISTYEEEEIRWKSRFP